MFCMFYPNLMLLLLTDCPWTPKNIFQTVVLPFLLIIHTQGWWLIVDTRYWYDVIWYPLSAQLNFPIIVQAEHAEPLAFVCFWFRCVSPASSFSIFANENGFSNHPELLQLNCCRPPSHALTIYLSVSSQSRTLATEKGKVKLVDLFL